MEIFNTKLEWSTPIVLESTGSENSVMIRGHMLPYGKTSRNGKYYSFETVKEAKFSHDTVSLDHDDSIQSVVGHYQPIWHAGKGWDFQAVIQNTNYQPGIVQLIKSGLVKHVSIEGMVNRLNRRDDGSVDVQGLDILGLSLVKTPGHPDATFAIAESFKGCEKMQGKITEEKKSEYPFELVKEGHGKNTSWWIKGGKLKNGEWAY